MEPPPGSGWRCSKCLKTFNTKANLRYHMFSHDTFAKAKCEICGKVLKNPLVLSQHIKRHHTKRDRPSCNICHRVFATPQNLRAHISTVHNRTKRPRFPCEFPGCGKTYLNKEGVSTHIKAEHSENPIRFPCTLCGKEFEAKRDLELHINTHTTEKAYICPNCGRGFAHRTSLKNHECIGGTKKNEMNDIRKLKMRKTSLEQGCAEDSSPRTPARWSPAHHFQPAISSP
ncbi:gastrula zinc finger protein XlCGF8.2DB-like [Folsomia candida]|uniref:gastrula zinc finger protein XlCGF8.2DB-like n=1 Tax=Folsomia candida TaxID=158441 RepID=UPI001604A78E|nr:gastrula zinc finger protein XlCGF8.2DB-like [Folsomia candida]